MRTMAYQVVGDVQVVAHRPESPNAKEWAEFLRATEAASSTARKVLVYAGDSTLDARQRAQIGELTRAYKLQVALIIRSTVTRGVATAIGWITGTHRAFDPQRLDSALDYIGVPPGERRAVRDTLNRLLDDLHGRSEEPAASH